MGGATAGRTAAIRRRGDIEGLRAVAVLLVLALHAGLPLAGGFVGVDVFFVISGYLITALLVRELRWAGTISLRGFYARRVRRLLPAASTVLAVTALLTVVLLPRARWRDVGLDTLASALYVQNWRLAERSVDYAVQGDALSPLQHFWSLGVEEQFYLFWPLLILLLGARLRWRRRPSGLRSETTLLVGLSAVVLASLAWSVHYTAVNQSGAYFVSTTRLWELGVGGVLALVAERLSRMPALVSAGVGWVGLVVVLGSAVLLDAETPFPGYVALAPVLGTAAVIAAGHGPGPRLLLDTRPLRWVGGLSYSVYLWHWPLLVVAGARLGRLSMLEGVAVVVLSFVPAYLSYRFVETPVRTSRRLRSDPVGSLSLGLFGTATAVAVALLVVIATPRAAPITSLVVSADASPDATQPAYGAQVLRADPRDDPAGAPRKVVDEIYPDPAQAANDVGPGFCGATIEATTVRSCSGGDLGSGIDVALVGDSHAQQWTSPLFAVGKSRGWKITGYTKGGCPFVDQAVVTATGPTGQETGVRPYTQCATWRNRVLDTLTGAARPDLVVISSGDHVPWEGGTAVGGEDADALMRRGYQRIIKRFVAQGTRVVVIADTPNPIDAGIDVPECVAQHRSDLMRCAFSRASGQRAAGSQLKNAATDLGGRELTVIDLGDAICPDTRCAPVIGGVVVWRDSNHLSATYAGSLAPRLEKLMPTLD